MTHTDHWNRRTLDFISPYLEQARSNIRVSTGFFTVEGFNLIRRFLDEKSVYILVGYDEHSRERLRQLLIDDIMLHLSRWDEENRRTAVLELVRKLRAGQMRVVEIGETEMIDARIRKKDHGKIYIIDDSTVLVGSSNLTVSGLIHNTEGVAAVSEPERIKQWISDYNKYWNAEDTHDLTDELLLILMSWLELSEPYDVYLKTLLALTPEDPSESPRASYKMPVKYQQVAIERVIRQLKDWRGAFLVASTGLGKTIMATHTALRLSREGEIHNVIVFAPKQVLPNWEETLDSAGLNTRSFTRELLDFPERKRGKVKEMLQILDRVDDKYIIIIDESQYFRNQERQEDGEKRRSFRRLVRTVNEKQPYVILLTATPLAKGVEDLNNQLRLLPHTAPKNMATETGQIAFEGFDMVETNTWRVQQYLEDEDSSAAFDEFRQLPVCTVISTSQVAKAFATPSPEGDYVDFGEQQRWLPKIELRKVTVPVPFEVEMCKALDDGYFKHYPHKFKQRGQWMVSESTIEKEANIAWASSPFALKEILSKTIQGTYDVPYKYDHHDRERVLSPILQKIIAMRFEDDLKLRALVAFLKKFIDDKRKVIIFTERRATAFYIEQGLGELVSSAKVASVVYQSLSGNFELKPPDEVNEIILNFAPEANRNQLKDEPLRHYDVFVSTDAYGVGVNLQDASVVISYDLAWTPDVIIQRAGRILRFWSKPRKVDIYAFVGAFQENTVRQRESSKIEERLRTLSRRTHQAAHFNPMPIIPDEEKVHLDSLSDLPDVKIEDLGEADITEIEEFSGQSPFLRHITALSDNIAKAEMIPDDITSAMEYDGADHLVYMLLKYQGTYAWMLYNISSRKLTPIKEDKLLGLIECDTNEIVAGVNPDVIEHQAQSARKAWIKENKIERPEQVERIAAMYLLPKSERKFEGVFE